MAFGHAVQTLLFFWFLTRVNPSPANQISTDDLSTKSMRSTFASYLISGWHWSIYTERFLQQPGSQTKFLHKRVAYYSNSTATYNPVLLKLSLSMDVQPNPGPGIPRKNATLRCFLQNARSLKGETRDSPRRCKLQDFQELLYGNRLDLIAVTETWLTYDISDGEILSNGYQIFRNDRRDRKGGGTLLAINNSLSATRIDTLGPISILDYVAARLCLKNDRKLIVIVIYRPPDSPADWINSFQDLMDSFGNDSNVLILGDFNMPNINWIKGSGFSNALDLADFCDFLGDKNLFQLVTEPTRAHNILNLVITNMEDSISSLEVSKDLSIPSDHYSVIFDLQISHWKIKSSYNFKKGDFDSLRTLLKSTSFDDIFQNNDIETCWSTWKQRFIEAVDKCIPKLNLS